MKILFDARFIRPDHFDGISRFSAELAQALSEHEIELELLICDDKQREHLPDAPYHKIHAPTSLKEFWVARTLNTFGPDVVFCPMQTMGSWGRNYKLILTLHDMIYYTHNTPPKFLALPIRIIWKLFHAVGYWPQRLLLNRADVVATVSKTSKDLILEHRLTDRPVEVISNAPTSLFTAKASKETTKNLLYVGSFSPYKNVSTLVHALHFLPDYTLHCLSKVSTTDRAQLIKDAPNERSIVFHNGVDDKTYKELLLSSHALVTASRAEGFGLPIIEALSAHVPVVCSDIPIFHEVAGDAAIYFDPNNPSELAKKIIDLEDKKLREQLAEKSEKQAATFSWERSAQQLLDAVSTIDR